MDYATFLQAWNQALLAARLNLLHIFPDQAVKSAILLYLFGVGIV